MSAGELFNDTLTESGAYRLAKRLDEYWHARGWPKAKHWVEIVRARETMSKHSIFGVRCNLMNGYPPQ